MKSERHIESAAEAAGYARRLRLVALGLAVAACAALVLAVGAGAGDKAAGEKAPPKPTEGKPKVIGPADITFVDDEPETPGQPAQSVKPADKPASNPFSPAGGFNRRDAVPGYLELSSGLKVPGHIFTTRAARLKIYNLDREIYEYVPVPALKSIDTEVELERMDKEWRFKEAGSPEKVYSGRECPVRKVSYTLTLLNDHKIRGHILGQPLYVAHNDKADRFLLHDRDKGAMGQTLADIPYIKRVELGPEAYNRAVDELKATAEAAAKKAAGGAVKAPLKK
ncbi:MAG: hypothetical protein NTY65_08720 [Planctomycetota bacterium]|nr:hypothetical protein [Planctomycetota bacterium]